MKIASYNLRLGGVTGPNNHWMRLMRNLDPDIVCAQETRSPEAYFSATDYATFDGCVHQNVPHGRWGSAILSRNFHLEPLSIAGFEGWVVAARIPNLVVGGASKSTLIVSVHIPSPGPYVPTVERLLDSLADLVKENELIIAGDFNITTARRHASEAGPKNTKGELRVLDRMRDEFGLTNAWQALHQDEPLPQTLRWAKNPQTPYHCDAVFVSAGLLAFVTNASVESSDEWTSISDHNPILVNIA